MARAGTPRLVRLIALGAVGTTLAVTALAGPASAAPPRAKTPTPPPKTAGTVTIGAEQFPTVLNGLTPEGASEWTAITTAPALARGYLLTPDFQEEPWLFSKDCTVVTQGPFTVDCTIRPDAVWSDGVPLTANDFKFTYQTIMDPKSDVVTRDGYDKVTAFNVVSPTEFQMVFSQVFAPFRELWAGSTTTVLPQHILQGQDFNKVWNACICDPKTKQPIGSGPYLVQSFTPDTQLTLVPNPRWWGSPKPQVKKIVFIPITDSNSEVNAFRSGEVDAIYPQNQLGLREKIQAVSGATYESSLGPDWEHFDMLTTVKGLNDINVRKAIATAMPRQQMVDRLVKPSNDQAKVLENTQWMTNQHQYVPHWQVYPEQGDVAAAKKMLDRAGWKMKSGVRQKGKTKLQFTIGVTAGNQARELAEQIIQQQLKPLGIKLKAKNSEDILDVKLTAFNYQTIIFAWVGAPDPFSGNTIWRADSIPKVCSSKDAKAGNCDTSGQNYTRTRNQVVTGLLKQTDVTVDPTQRAALYNQVDQELATNAVTSIPLFQKPTVLATDSKLHGVTDNSTVDGFTWSIENWTYSG